MGVVTQVCDEIDKLVTEPFSQATAVKLAQLAAGASALLRKFQEDEDTGKLVRAPGGSSDLTTARK